MKSSKVNHYEARLQALTDSLVNPYSNVNLDVLLDCLVAIVYEAKSSTKDSSKNLKSIIGRLLPASKFLQESRINRADFETISILGKGAFGEVSLVKHIGSNRVFALKTMSKFELAKRESIVCLWEEREIMALSKSDWFVKMFYSFQDDKNLYMVMEFVQGGDMVNFMSVYEPNEKMAKFYIAELASALDILHNLGFVHRDVKPDNILVERSGHIKLCDFGTCVRMDEKGRIQSSTALGTPDYISPEVLLSQSNEGEVYGKECDWWAVGVFMYEFLLGDTPFYAESLAGTYNKILNYKNSLQYPSDVDISQEAREVIGGLLTDKKERIGRNGISDLKVQAFFKNVPWTWENIRNTTPPIVPSFTSDVDTNCFDEITSDGQSQPTPDLQSSFPFNGDHFSFIGFSYNSDFKPYFTPQKLSVKDEKAKEIREDVEILAKKVIELNEEVAEHKMIKERLTHNLMEMETKLEEESKYRSSARIMVDEMKMEFLLKEQEISSNKALVEELQCKMANMQQLMNSQTLKKGTDSHESEEITKWKNKIATLEQEKLALIHKARDLTWLHDVALNNETMFKQKYEDSVRDYHNLERQKAEYQDQIHESANKIGELEKTIGSYEVNVKSLSKQVTEVTAMYKTVNDQINNILTCFNCKNFSELTTFMNNYHREDGSVSSESKLDKTLNSLHSSVAENSISASPMKVDSFVSSPNILSHDREELSREIQEAFKSKDEYMKKCQQLQNTLQQVTTEKGALSEKMDDLLTRFTALTVTEDRAQKKIKEWEHKYDKLRSDNVTQLADFNSLKELMRRLEFETSQAFRSYDNANLNLKNAEHLISELRVQNETLETTISALQNTNNELVSSLSKKNSELIEMSCRSRQAKLANNSILESVKNYINCENKKVMSTVENISSKFLNVEHLVRQLEFGIKNKSRLLEENILKHEALENQIVLEADKYETKLEIERKLLEQERILKQQAVKKLNEVLVMPSSGITPKNRRIDASERSEKKYEQQYKNLQLEFKKESEKSAGQIRAYEKRINQLNQTVKELTNMVENLRKGSASETNLAGASSTDLHTNFISEDTDNCDEMISGDSDVIIKESFLFIPSKNARSSRKIHWTRVQVKLTNKTLTCYKDTATNKEEASVITSIPLDALYHVRGISQNDLIHADAKDIEKIFQVLYNDASEMASSPLDELSERCQIISNHCMIPVQYHMPTTCDVCNKGLWGFIRSSPALECKYCHFRCHKEHGNEPARIPNCKAHDKKWVAKELLYMASSPKEKKNWINTLLKLIKVPKPQPSERRGSLFSIRPRSSFKSAKDVKLN